MEKILHVMNKILMRDICYQCYRDLLQIHTEQHRLAITALCPLLYPVVAVCGLFEKIKKQVKTRQSFHIKNKNDEKYIYFIFRNKKS